MHNVLVLTAAIMKSQFLYQLCDVQVQLLLERVVQHCIVDNSNDIYIITNEPNVSLSRLPTHLIAPLLLFYYFTTVTVPVFLVLTPSCSV